MKRKTKLPALPVLIYRDGQPSRTVLIPDPRIYFCRSFNRPRKTIRNREKAVPAARDVP